MSFRCEIFLEFSRTSCSPNEHWTLSVLDFKGNWPLRNVQNFDPTSTRKIARKRKLCLLNTLSGQRLRGNRGRPLRSFPPFFPSLPFRPVLFVRIALFVSRLVSYTGGELVCACHVFAKVAGARLSPLMETARERAPRFADTRWPFASLALARLDSRKSGLDGFVAPKRGNRFVTRLPLSSPNPPISIDRACVFVNERNSPESNLRARFEIARRQGAAMIFVVSCCFFRRDERILGFRGENCWQVFHSRERMHISKLGRDNLWPVFLGQFLSAFSSMI